MITIPKDSKMDFDEKKNPKIIPMKSKKFFKSMFIFYRELLPKDNLKNSRKHIPEEKKV